MSNDLLFYTQIASIFVYVGSLFVLYRLIVEKKDATIQFLEKQLAAAKEDSSDIVLKRLSDRVQIARDEMERLSKDKESLQGMNEKSLQYIEALRGVIRADEALINLHKKQREEIVALHEKQQNELYDVLEKLEESGTVLVHKDKEGIVQRVTFAPKEQGNETESPG